MKCIGENLNVMKKSLAQAFQERDPQPIRALARAQQQAGMAWIDVNLGPARQQGPELMDWLVRTIQEEVDMPLSLDTSNIEAMEAGLAAHKGKALINSIMCRRERYEAMLPLVSRYGADMIALLWGPEGLPRDENERAAWAVELIYAANEIGIDNQRIYVDPIITPLNIQQPQLVAVLNFMEMLPEIAPGARSVCGLSNLSNGTPWREPLNQTYLVMLKQAGMTSAIVDYNDSLLLEIAAGQRPDIEQVVAAVKAGALSNPEEVEEKLGVFVRAARVILGHSVYSDSWMNL
jgi:5-methyltetrahydrofolate corrinoid/iron sulfur protein methyltransferase